MVVLVLSACTVASFTSVSDVKPGDCFDNPPASEMVDGGITDLPTIDCDEPHRNEVFATFDVVDGPFPGIEALDDVAEACVPLFEDYVGVPLDDEPELDIIWIIPTAESWEGGYRTVVCALYNADVDEISGSLRAGGS